MVGGGWAQPPLSCVKLFMSTDFTELVCSDFIKKQVDVIAKAHGFASDFELAGVQSRSYIFISKSQEKKLYLFIDDEDFYKANLVAQTVLALTKVQQNKIPCETFLLSKDRTGGSFFGYMIVDLEQTVPLIDLGIDFARYEAWHIGACLGILHNKMPIPDKLPKIDASKLKQPLLSIANNALKAVDGLAADTGFCHGNICPKTVVIKANNGIRVDAEMPIFKFVDFSFCFFGNRLLDAFAAMISLGLHLPENVGKAFFEGYMFGRKKNLSQKAANTFLGFAQPASALVFVREYAKTKEALFNLADYSYNKHKLKEALEAMQEFKHPQADTAKRLVEELQ
jgi:hypothetical protein